MQNDTQIIWYMTQFILYLIGISASFYLFQFLDFEKLVRKGTSPRIIVFMHLFLSIACGFLVGNFLIMLVQIGQQFAGLL